MSTLEKPDQRMFSLDILRGLAASLVLIRHAPEPAVRPNNWSEACYSIMAEIGWTGVDLFFVLSGFLITNLILREWETTGSFKPFRFWIRRSFKIWPTYYIAYGGVVLLWILRDIYLGKSELINKHALNSLPNIFFLQNYLPCQPWSHSWSLAVEEHFYILLPLLCLVFFAGVNQKSAPQNSLFKYLVVTFLLISIGTLLSRTWTVLQGGNWSANYYPSHQRFDSLFCGVMLAGINRYFSQIKSSIHFWLPLGVITLISGWVMINLLPLHDNPNYYTSTFGFTILMLGYGALVLTAGFYPDLGKKGILPVRILCNGLAFIGVYSYTIYLAHATIFGVPGVESIHQLVLRILEHQLHIPIDIIVWLDRFAFFLISVGGGILLSHVIERPFLKMRSRLFPSYQQQNMNSISV